MTSNGKEIDTALGDILRSLLNRPAEAVGDLFADAIGILGDRVKLKRERNTKMGLEATRKRLAANGIDENDVIQPKEEELYILLNGMSLADEESIRDMWAGLLAKALDPNSEITAKRPFTSVLESLSPLDATVIDLLAFIQWKDTDLKAKIKPFAPKDSKNLTPEEVELGKQITRENAELLEQVLSAIRQKAKDYGLSEACMPGWADNLMRLGVIARKPTSDPFGALFRLESLVHSNQQDLYWFGKEIYEYLRETLEVSRSQDSPPERLFLKNAFNSGFQANPFNLQRVPEVQLTAFGRQFASACDLI